MACKTLDEICDCVSPAPDGSCYSPSDREFTNWVTRLLCAIRAGGGGGGGSGIVTAETCLLVTADGAWGSTGDTLDEYVFFDTSVLPPVEVGRLWYNQQAQAYVTGINTSNSVPCPDEGLGGDCDRPLFTLECGQEPAPGALVSSSVTGAVVIPAGFWSVSIMNVGSAAGVVDGQPLLEGEVFNLSGYVYRPGSAAGEATVLTPAINIDGTGTTLRVRTFV